MRRGSLAVASVTLSMALVTALAAVVIVASGATSQPAPVIAQVPSVANGGAASSPPADSSMSDAASTNEAGSARHAARFDAGAMDAGFTGPYRFVARLTGIPDTAALGSVVRGAVSDPTHFILEFPESGFITRYTRKGGDAIAVVNGHKVPVAVEASTYAALSPEDLLPAQLWAAEVGSWASTLEPGTAAGSFAAQAGVLTATARRTGLVAADWQLSALTDGSGRLTQLSFGGLRSGRPFLLDVAVSYG